MSPSGAHNPSPPSEIRALTGLRGVAALFVVFYHFKAFGLVSGRTQIALRHGYLSVDLFFVLSGFVMAMAYGDLFTRGIDKRDVAVFLGRRIARIYPLYIVLLPFGFFMRLPSFVAWYGHALFAVTLANIFLIQSWHISDSFILPAWSISIELAAYLIFPWLYNIIASSRGSSILMIALGCFLMLTFLDACHGFHGGSENRQHDIWKGDNFGPLFRCIPEFTLGLLTWRAAQWPMVHKLIQASWLSTVLAAVIIGLLAFNESDIAVVALFPLLVLSLHNNVSWLARMLARPLVHRLGVVSYAIYLLHYLFALPDDAVWHDEHPWRLFSVKLAAVFFFGLLAYECIEKPSRRILRRALVRGHKTAVGDEPNPNLSAP